MVRWRIDTTRYPASSNPRTPADARDQVTTMRSLLGCSSGPLPRERPATPNHVALQTPSSLYVRRDTRDRDLRRAMAVDVGNRRRGVRLGAPGGTALCSSRVPNANAGDETMRKS